MKCYYVLVHGRLDWSAAAQPTGDDAAAIKPAGFYCHRYVLASSMHFARETAFRRVRQNFDRQTGWITMADVKLDLEAEDTVLAPMFRLLMPDNRGHTFYEAD